MGGWNRVYIEANKDANDPDFDLSLSADDSTAGVTADNYFLNMANHWMQIGVIIERYTNAVRFYRDGALYSTASLGGSAQGAYTFTTNFALGANRFDNGNNQSFQNLSNKGGGTDMTMDGMVRDFAIMTYTGSACGNNVVGNQDGIIGTLTASMDSLMSDLYNDGFHTHYKKVIESQGFPSTTVVTYLNFGRGELADIKDLGDFGDLLPMAPYGNTASGGDNSPLVELVPYAENSHNIPFWSCETVRTNFMQVPNELPSGSQEDPYWTNIYCGDLGKNVFPANVMPACPDTNVANTIAGREHDGVAKSWTKYSSKNPTVVRNVFNRYNFERTTSEWTPISYAVDGPATIRQRATASFIDPNSKPEGK